MTDKLSNAIEYVEKHHPLPRCKHGNALQDGAGENLEPSCGCRLTPIAEKQARELAQVIIIESSHATGRADSAWLDGVFKHELTTRITTALQAARPKDYDLDPLEFWCDLAEVLGHERPVKADVPALVSEVRDRLSPIVGEDLKGDATSALIKWEMVSGRKAMSPEDFDLLVSHVAAFAQAAAEAEARSADAKHQADLIRRDGFMCEAHPGLEFEHNTECAGPGMAWIVEGKKEVESIAEAAREGERERIVGIITDYNRERNSLMQSFSLTQIVERINNARPQLLVKEENKDGH